MDHKKEEQNSEEAYTDFANVETQRNFLTREDLIEGPYGSPINRDEPVKNKTTPWEKDQQYYSAFTYEFRNLHQNLPRQFPGAHPPHDEKKKKEEKPYSTPESD
ncbi:cytosolic protein [Thalassorhabdus alkalitolerans]|uniref:Cytosolic protein n=1 Tax=Thalassorhabdus alkalitolerans TaxID=2282697 RepID=A0ABW0YR73_9BACI|nr:hypothetical protein [Thalassobacillus sp. C254]